MLFSYDWLQSFFNKKLPAPRQLADLILARGFEVEGVEKSGKDWVLDVNILSCRPDCLSHIGMAREIGAYLGVKPIFPKSKSEKSKKTSAVKTMITVEIKDDAMCPRYTAMAVIGVKVKPSPQWMARRLEACGSRAINNVVDATNYAMLETGQPLHAFDWEKLASGHGNAKKIIVRRAATGEKFETLDAKKFVLESWMGVIADEAGALALAGIKGGKRAEVDQKTSMIILESANFDAKTIRKTARGLGLSTDASYRFEHGIDANGTAPAARRAAELIALNGGGQILAGAVDKRQNLSKSKKIILNISKAESLLGAPIQTAAAKKSLEALGFLARRASRDDLEINVPPERNDVIVWQDVVEEIGRINGYEKIAPAPPRAAILPPRENDFWRAKNNAKDLLMAAGYSETRNYSFVSRKDCQNFAIDLKNLLEIANPVNEDLRFLRPSLLINLLKNFCANREFDSLRQFEVGKVFAEDKRDEPIMLAGAARGDDFFATKGVLEFLAAHLRAREFSVAPLKDYDDGGVRVFDVNHFAAIMTGKKPIGYLGRLRREIAENIGIEPMIVFELDFVLLTQNISQKVIYQPLFQHPKAARDISVDMPLQTLSASVPEIIMEAKGAELIEAVEIPDAPYVYPDKKRKNILYRFHLRSDKKTLDTQDIDAWQKSAIAAIERDPEWRVKKN